MNIKELQQEIHENAKEHGWWDEDRVFGELIALCHSELSEALEEYRDGKHPWEKYYSCSKCVPGCNGDQASCHCKRVGEKITLKPEGVPTELADVVIRIMDMCGRYGIDLEQAMIEKHEYNKTRPYKHGGKVI